MGVFERAQFNELKRKNLIVVILIDKLKKKDLPKELREYLKLTSYIDATEDTENVTELLRLVTWGDSTINFSKF